MKEYLKTAIEKAKQTKFITDIQIEEFESIDELTKFVEYAKSQGIGTVLHYETSNYHNGVVIHIFDKTTCIVKSFLNI